MDRTTPRAAQAAGLQSPRVPAFRVHHHGGRRSERAQRLPRGSGRGVLLPARGHDDAADDAGPRPRRHSDPRGRSAAAAAARSAFAAAFCQHCRARHRAPATARRAGWLPLVLRSLPVPALCGIRARQRHRKTTAADFRSLLWLAAEPHLPGVRHRRAQALSEERFVATSTPVLTVDIAGRRWRVGTQGRDISIPLEFDAPQPTFFGASPAAATVVSAGSFIGDVQRGGSCNCSTHTLTPHCNGTHTECVGHVTAERLSVRDLSGEHFSAALLVSVQPTTVITRAALAAAVAPHELHHYRALVIRTLPNTRAKLQRNYDRAPAPYFDAEAMQWIVSNGISTLVVDLPSLDRGDDAQLTTHRIFWGLPPGATTAAQATRRNATVTELAFIDDSVADGQYLLNLQVAPFVADAAPSRPILLPLTPS